MAEFVDKYGQVHRAVVNDLVSPELVAKQKERAELEDVVYNNSDRMGNIDFARRRLEQLNQELAGGDKKSKFNAANDKLKAKMNANTMSPEMMAALASMAEKE
ncbi:MAG TPA: hypothetical protein DD611_01955 [Alphaproteobacteria bacterium]|nr:hypothetical protein [Alphaproteobacteria bacterium]HBS76709.1 hypothetical protein [Alphaproteobacteria bacterium]